VGEPQVSSCIIAAVHLLLGVMLLL